MWDSRTSIRSLIWSTSRESAPSGDRHIGVKPSAPGRLAPLGDADHDFGGVHLAPATSRRPAPKPGPPTDELDIPRFDQRACRHDHSTDDTPATNQRNSPRRRTTVSPTRASAVTTKSTPRSASARSPGKALGPTNSTLARAGPGRADPATETDVVDKNQGGEGTAHHPDDAAPVHPQRRGCAPRPALRSRRDAPSRTSLDPARGAGMAGSPSRAPRAVHRPRVRGRDRDDHRRVPRLVPVRPARSAGIAGGDGAGVPTAHRGVGAGVRHRGVGRTDRAWVQRAQGAPGGGVDDGRQSRLTTGAGEGRAPPRPHRPPALARAASGRRARRRRVRADPHRVGHRASNAARSAAGALRRQASVTSSARCDGSTRSRSTRTAP